MGKKQGFFLLATSQRVLKGLVKKTTFQACSEKREKVKEKVAIRI